MTQNDIASPRDTGDMLTTSCLHGENAGLASSDAPAEELTWLVLLDDMTDFLSDVWWNSA